MILYKLTNTVTDKSYIGITRRDLKTRIREHRRAAFKLNRTTLFCDALREFGAHSFECEVLGVAKNIENLLTMEALAIEVHETLVPAGYNQSLGGLGTPGSPHSEETRRKISEKAKGRPVSEETRAKLSLAFKGKPSPNLGRKIGRTWNKGLHHSDESREKMSVAHSGNNNWNARAIKIDDVEYQSIFEAMEKTGMSRMQIKYRLKDGRIEYVDSAPGNMTGQSRRVEYQSVEYPSARAAGIATGTTRRVFEKLLQSGEARYLTPPPQRGYKAKGK